MRRLTRWLLWIAACLLGILGILLGVVVFGNNTGAGQRMFGHILSGATGGKVTTSGDPFWSPDHLHFDNLQLHDKQGVYLRLHDVTIDWSVLQLIHGKAVINKLTVGSATLERLPQSFSQTSTGKTSSGLPVTVVLHQLVVDRLDLAPVIGRPYALKLEGSGTLESYTQGNGSLTATEIGGPAVYKLDADIGPAQFKLDLSAHEPPHGLIASVAKLPQLGGIAIDARLDGPRDAVATELTAKVGQLDAQAHGTIDLAHKAANLTVAAQAPAMQPRHDLSWQSVALHARVQGSFTRPSVDGRLAIDRLAAYGGGVRQLTALVSGDQGLVHVQAQADGLTIPGSHPDLLAGSPLTLDATAHLAGQDRPVEFTLRHRLISAQGSAQTAGVLAARVHLAIPQLQPFAAVAGADLHGHTTLDLRGSEQAGTTRLAVAGTIGLDAGMQPAPALIGNDATIDAAVDLHGNDLTIERFALNGQDARAAVHGSVAGGTVNLDWSAAVSRLDALDPALAGQLQAQGHVGGSSGDLSLGAEVGGEVATHGVNSGPFTAHLQAHGLPDAPGGQLTAQGALLGAPVQLAVAAQKLPGGAYHVAIDRADWKSAHAAGQLTVNPPALVPHGTLTLAMTRLADLDPLLHEHVAGSLQARLESSAAQADLSVQMRHVALPGTASVTRADLQLAIANPATAPVVDGRLALDGFSAGRLAGSATLRAKGPQDALAVQLAASLPQVYGAAARVDAGGVVDVPQQAVTLRTLRADWKTIALRLLQPARIQRVGGGIGVQHLRLAVDRGTLAVNGTAGKTLDLTLDLRDLPAGIASAVSPRLAASGTISAQAHLTGAAGRPDGTVRLAVRQLHLRSGPGRAIPPATLTADATLHNGEARLNARLGVGASRLVLAGAAPVTGGGPLDLRATGAVDLAMLDPLIAAEGRRVAGRLALDTSITGSLRKPHIAGTATLAGGEVQDYTYGVHLRQIAATLQADGTELRLTRFTARAGAGTLGGSGTIGLAAPMPVNLAFTAHDATPIANEILTERLDARLAVVGAVQGNLAVQGDIHVLHADIQIPDKLPHSVAVIPVVNPNAPPAPPKRPGPAVNLTLNLAITARQVFVRGHGLDADLGGTVHVGGTSATPVATGGLALQRGTFSLVGTTLNFTEGTIDFVGAGITDPGLHFVATTTGNNITATLTIGGTVHDPKITLSSVPQLPQDEILAQILFHRSVSSLSPFEVAQVASALASFTGVTSGLDPLANLRKSLGLDRLSVGTNALGNPTVQAGRYLAPGIYLGAKQNATGAGTQAELQIDIAKGLKLDTTAGASSMSATGADASGQAASVGITYQFQY